MGFFTKRRARRTKPNSLGAGIASMERLEDPRNAVSAFRQRMAEDPDFETSFMKAMMRAKAESDELARKFASDYFGETDDPGEIARLKSYGMFAGKALAEIIDAVANVAESDVDHSEDSEAFIRNVGQALLGLADEAYIAGSISLQSLRQGDIATNDPEIGTLVAWERAQDAGMTPDQLDRISYIYRQLGE